MKRLLTLALLSISAALPMRGAAIDVVCAQFDAYYTAASADRSTPRMENALYNLESVTRQITSREWLRSDGSWSDIDYDEIPAGGWGPWDHSRRLIVMAKAYRTPGQGLYRDPSLLADINAALAYEKRFYGATVFPAGNWWFWTIGIPIDLGPTLLLMQGHADQALIDDLTLAMQIRIGSSPTSRGIVGPVPTGENLVWSSFTHLCLALLKNDTAMLAAVSDAMTVVARPTSGEGIKADGSFHQHGAQLYTGGYGGSFANDVARYALITRGTPYAMAPASLASFADYLADGIAWALYGNYFDVSVIGREVARPTTTGFNGIAALLQASQIDTPRRAEIRAAAAKMLESWGALPAELAGLAAQVETAGITGAWPEGHRHYFVSDYTVHRRANWFASVKMFSTRTKSGEDTNDENILGSRQSDGRFYLVMDGDEYFGRDVWPAFDWTRLPGVTVEQKADTASALYGYGKRTFAGGTGDGRNGVSAMELAPLGSVLTARKSWFFFDDAIVFLANGITSPSANRVETIVNQWPLMNAAAQVTRHDDWAVLERVGYWFPSTTGVQISRETRTGTWSSLGGSSDTTQRSREIVTMWLDHGTSPMNATAEYAIVPGVSPVEMADWAASRPLTIVANDDTTSAVRDNRTGALGITFWRAGAVEGVQSTAAAVVYMSGDLRAMHVTVADPNAGTTGTFQLTIPGPWTTKDVPYAKTVHATTLTIPRNGGRTTTVELQRATTRRRAVR
jgi:chondroitin AC lyase